MGVSGGEWLVLLEDEDEEAASSQVSATLLEAFSLSEEEIARLSREVSRPDSG